MGYAVGLQTLNGVERHIGYSVTAYCDHPGCKNEIDRGMDYACCRDPSHDKSCGGYFCPEHQEAYIYSDELEDLSPEELEAMGLDPDISNEGEGIVKCNHAAIEFKEHPDWLRYVLNADTWQAWRDENPEMVVEYKKKFDEQAKGSE